MRPPPPVLVALLSCINCSEANPLYDPTGDNTGSDLTSGGETPTPQGGSDAPSSTGMTMGGDGTQVDSSGMSSSSESTSMGRQDTDGSETGSAETTQGESTSGTVERPASCAGPAAAMCHDSVNYLVETAASSLDGDDQDADGDIDLVVASADDDAVMLLRNEGGGLLAAGPVTVVPNTRPMGICFADLDGRPPLEIVTANRDGDSITILTEDGGATLTVATSVDTNARTEDCAVGDIDDDGDQDVIAAIRDDHALAFLLNDGAGELSASPLVPVLAQPETLWAGVVETATFSGLAVGASHLGGRGVSIHTSGGRRGVVSTVHETDEHHYGVHLDDLDLDGTLDLVSSRPSTGVVVVYWDIMAPGDPETTLFAIGDGPGHVATGDLNADGAPDAVVVLENADRFVVLSGVGNHAFAVTTFPLSAAASDVFVAELNGDGIDDLALTLPGLGEVAVYLSEADR